MVAARAYDAAVRQLKPYEVAKAYVNFKDECPTVASPARKPAKCAQDSPARAASASAAPGSQGQLAVVREMSCFRLSCPLKIWTPMLDTNAQHLLQRPDRTRAHTIAEPVVLHGSSVPVLISTVPAAELASQEPPLQPLHPGTCGDGSMHGSGVSGACALVRS